MTRLALALTLLLAPPAAADADGPWMTDYEAARQLARRTGRPLFVVFRCEH